MNAAAIGNLTIGAKVVRAVENSASMFRKAAKICGGGLIKYTKKTWSCA